MADTTHELGCLIVQSDLTVLLEKNHPHFSDGRDLLLRCAELEKCPEHLHSYRLTALSLWNAAATGMSSTEVLAELERLSKYPIPSAVHSFVVDMISRYGKLQLVRTEEGLFLEVLDPQLIDFVWKTVEVRAAAMPGFDHAASCIPLQPAHRGKVKVALIKSGMPVEDRAGYVDGDPFPLSRKESFISRSYQSEAAHAFYLDNTPLGGSGVICLPCGAGKTMVGIEAMLKLQMKTLIVTANVTALRQWRDELLSKTAIDPDNIGEYSGFDKSIKPVTIATYQILTHRKKDEQTFPHLSLFESVSWGLIIYDEVHLLPAPIFGITANIQARRRLGLTATLVREDKREDEVFSLIGPKRYELPWKVLEAQGWIASATCTEIRVPMEGASSIEYLNADERNKFRIAAVNPLKTYVVKDLIERHAQERILIIGLYVDQLHALAQELSIPIIEGSTSQKKREAIYQQFRDGEIRILIVSKVANFSVDLPDASVAIQISGTFGSRQEEAQRLGRILRPKKGANQAFFYSLISRTTKEQTFALNRQLFLVEQGYEYCIQEVEYKTHAA